MDRTEKAAVIDRVAEQITESEAVFAVDYRGLTVSQAAELRTRLREADATFRVVKNTLSERAADKAECGPLKEFLQGPTAMTFVRGDAALAAKTLSDFRKAEDVLVFKGGWMNGALLTADEMDAISKLPSRDVLYARLTGMVASPLTGLVTGLNNLIAGLARQLQLIADQGLLDAPAPVATPADTGEKVEPAPAPEASSESASADAAPADAAAQSTTNEPQPGEAAASSEEPTENKEEAPK